MKFPFKDTRPYNRYFTALEPRLKTRPLLSQEAFDDTFPRLTTILTEAALLEQVGASDGS